jgi:hypothetical protein
MSDVHCARLTVSPGCHLARTMPAVDQTDKQTHLTQRRHFGSSRVHFLLRSLQDSQDRFASLLPPEGRSELRSSVGILCSVSSHVSRWLGQRAQCADYFTPADFLRLRMPAIPLDLPRHTGCLHESIIYVMVSDGASWGNRHLTTRFSHFIQNHELQGCILFRCLCKRRRGF